MRTKSFQRLFVGTLFSGRSGNRPASEGVKPPCPDVVSICFLRSEEHTSELQSHLNLVCRLLLEKKKNRSNQPRQNTSTTLLQTPNSQAPRPVSPRRAAAADSPQPMTESSPAPTGAGLPAHSSTT